MINLFKEKMKTNIYKEDSSLKELIEELKVIKSKLNPEGQRIIEQDIRNYEYGEIGEQNILFELKNSHLPAIVLRDICLTHNDLKAQIDFVIICPKTTYLIECKNLYGNIIINGNDFMRSSEFNGRVKKEGIYSPITQNQRHLDLLKEIKLSGETNKLLRFGINKYFSSNYKSIVVLANPKTILNDKLANKEIKEQVIRADQLTNYIKQMELTSKSEKLSEKDMFAKAEGFMSLHKPSLNTYITKYDSYYVQKSMGKLQEESIDKVKLCHDLKSYRKKKSDEDGVKAYIIFNNEQMELLIDALPRDIEALYQIPGFSTKRVEKYGEDILEIINTQ